VSEKTCTWEEGLRREKVEQGGALSTPLSMSSRGNKEKTGVAQTDGGGARFGGSDHEDGVLKGD